MHISIYRECFTVGVFFHGRCFLLHRNELHGISVSFIRFGLQSHSLIVSYLTVICSRWSYDNVWDEHMVKMQ